MCCNQASRIIKAGARREPGFSVSPLGKMSDRRPWGGPRTGVWVFTGGVAGDGLSGSG